MDTKILKKFDGKNILITGGTGLIGRQVAEILRASQAKITIASLDKITLDQEVEHLMGDLTDLDFCKKVTTDIDFVFHLAGIKGSIEVTRTHIASHFVPTLLMNTNLLEAARLNGVSKLVYTSSIGAYGDAELFRESDYRLDSIPMDFAGWAKRVAELQIYAYKVQYDMENLAIVRPCNVYGPGDNFDPENAMVIPSLMCRILRGEDPVRIWGDGSAIRDFAYSRDIAEGVILALLNGTRGGFVNLGSGKGVSIKGLVETLNQFLDFHYEFEPSKPSGAPVRVMDISLARQTLGYDPGTPLINGLKATWEWFVSHQGEYKMKKNYFRS